MHHHENQNFQVHNTYRIFHDFKWESNHVQSFMNVPESGIIVLISHHTPGQMNAGNAKLVECTLKTEYLALRN